MENNEQELTEQLMRIANSLEKIEKKMPDINTIFTPNELRSLFGKGRRENWPNEKSLSKELTIKEIYNLELQEFNEMIKENKE